MKSEKISNGAGALLIALVTMTNAYSVMPGALGATTWVFYIAAIGLALFCAELLARACDRFPNESFYGVLTKSLGKTSGKLIAGLLTLLTLLTCVISLTVFSRFVQISALPQTPQIILPFLCIMVAALSASGGAESSVGAARLLFWFVAFVFVVFVAVSLPQVFPRLLLPENTSAKSFFGGAGEVFLNRFGAVPAFMAIYTRMSDKKTRRKYMLGGIGGAGCALAIISAITIATLGKTTSTTDFYPIYTAMSLHSVGGFIQHTEIFACVAMTLCLFFKGAVCLTFSGDMIDKIFGIERKHGVFLPLAFICAFSTQLIYRDISSLRTMLEWKNGAIYILLLNVIIPIVVFIAAIRKKKKTH